MTGKCAHCGAEFDNAPVPYQGSSFVPTICKSCHAGGWRQNQKGNVYQKKDVAKELFAPKPEAPAPTPSTQPVTGTNNVIALLEIDNIISAALKLKAMLGAHQP